jgi:ATP-dependent Clp protease ATP-binding subunit ClpC
MPETKDFFDYRDVSEDSSLVLLLGIIKNGERDLRDFVVEEGVDIEALNSRLMSEVDKFDYQDGACVRAIFQRARSKKAVFNREENDICLLAATLSYGKSLAHRTLRSLGVDCRGLYLKLAERYDFDAGTFKMKGVADHLADKSGGELFDVGTGNCAIDLTRYYARNPGKAFKGRDAYLEKIIRILGKMRNNSVLLLGAPGTGKTALINEFAVRLAKGEVSGSLDGVSVVRIDLESMDPVPADFSKIKEFLVKTIAAHGGKDKAIFFLDWQSVELEDGDVFCTFNVLHLLRQPLRESGVRLILVGHKDTYEDFLFDCPEVVGLAEVVNLEESSHKESLEILRSAKSGYELHHGLTFSDESLRTIVAKSEIVVNSGVKLPGRALELLDKVGSHFSSKGAKQVGNSEVNSFCSREDDSSAAGAKPVSDRRLTHLSSILKKEVIGQDGPCQIVADAVVSLSDPESPVASLFFVGPSGVGKTLLAKRLAKALFGEEDAFFRFDMSEYFDRHEVSRLIGSPPGYLGHESGGQLTEKLRKRPKAVVLFDEVEKADPSIYNIFLQILSDGVLTDGKGNPCSFTQAVVIMTSNIDIRKGGPLGFSTQRVGNQVEMDLRNALQRNSFRRELVGRIDEIVEFNQLSRDDFLKIVDLELEKIRLEAFKRGVKEMLVADEAKRFLVDKSETAEYGARNLNRTLRHHLRIPLGRLISSKKKPYKVKIDLSGSVLAFS